MTTPLLFLDDFEVTTCTATVIAITKTEDGRAAIELNQTCFYARGGGQDWDTGVITSSGTDTVFKVTEVRLDTEGVVQHIGTYGTGEFQPGTAVTCTVDPARRTINTRLHSAGHALDMAVDRLNLPWIPLKGTHYPHMSFVEYQGYVEPENAESLRAGIELTANQLIGQGDSNEIRFMSVADMASICRHVPDTIPAHKPARVVIYNGAFGVPCGGTHVRTIGDIGRLLVTKVKTKKGVTKVSYRVEGIS